MTYHEFISRNQILIKEDIQEKIKKTRLLICGCGIGSYLAEALLRIGFLNMTLVDMDRVGASNLNRQNYIREDIGNFKSTALKKRLDLIYPEASIDATTKPLTQDNAKSLVLQSDIIIDTIDYIDITAILALHNEAASQQKPLISSMNAGFGAGLFYFPPNHSESLESYLKKTMGGAFKKADYKDCFAAVVKTLAPFFDTTVREMILSVLEKMKNSKPCPASQVTAGSMCCASLVTTCAVRILEKKPITPFPKFHYLNLHTELEKNNEPILS